MMRKDAGKCILVAEVLRSESVNSRRGFCGGMKGDFLGAMS
jgi:hypothetical protein